MHFLARAFEALGTVTVVVIVVIGIGAWLLSGVKPGDVP